VSETVVFVCEFGSKKSLLAARHFDRLARERGLSIDAVSRGITPDADMPDGLRQKLLAEGVDVRGFQPERLSDDDVTSARAVVSFLEDPLPRAYDWSDAPALSDDFAVARDDIYARVSALVDELARSAHVQGSSAVGP
jgi:arsenate reductase (thioredoxin)